MANVNPVQRQVAEEAAAAMRFTAATSVRTLSGLLCMCCALINGFGEVMSSHHSQLQSDGTWSCVRCVDPQNDARHTCGELACDTNARSTARPDVYSRGICSTALATNLQIGDQLLDGPHSPPAARLTQVSITIKSFGGWERAQNVAKSFQTCGVVQIFLKRGRCDVVTFRG